MKIVFAGTPDFALTALRALVDARHEIGLVISQPDRPSGRGMKLTPSPVKAFAISRGIEVLTPTNLNPAKSPEALKETLAKIRAFAPDVLVVAAFGMIVPEAMLEAPLGIGHARDIKAINIHASLLPRWRGAAPAARAIEAGDERFGVSLMRMDAGLDTGDIISTVDFPIEAKDTTATLTEKAAKAGADLLVHALASPETLTTTPQPEAGVTYAKKLLKEESRVSFETDAATLERKIRAFTPFPGVKCAYRDTEIRIHHATVKENQGKPGEILALGKEGVLVSCGKGSLLIDVLQRAGRPKMAADDFLRGFPLQVGESLR